ncbi:MAG: glycosyltransferase family 87 protein [Bacteroidota bacterium]|jgi:Glycosyltransferase family 87
MLKKLQNLAFNPLFISGLLILVTCIITTQSLLLEPGVNPATGCVDTHYNNYLIFKKSFFHLIENKDIYLEFKNEQMDYYKYSPAFSLMMAPLSILPDAAGLLIWNLLNCLLLFFAIWNLPPGDKKGRLIMIAIIFTELITSIQNSQSNSLIAGFILFAFIFLEKKQNFLAALAIVLTIYIKVFGLVSLALFLFYPGKLKSFLYTFLWIVILALLPLCVIPFSQLVYLYQSWADLLMYDHSISWGLSVVGWLHIWFPFSPKNIVLIAGILMFFLPFLKYKFSCNQKFRLYFLSSILIWMIIFNHKAESPTYIIAMTGVAVWIACQKMKVENLVLLVFALVFTSLSPTDLFPAYIREHYVRPYNLKVLPCVLIWLKITYDLLFFRNEKPPDKEILLTKH